MTVAEIGQLIGTYGFPIVMCGALFWFMVKKQDELQKVIADNTRMTEKVLDFLSRMRGIDDGQ